MRAVPASECPRARLGLPSLGQSGIAIARVMASGIRVWTRLVLMTLLACEDATIDIFTKTQGASAPETPARQWTPRPTLWSAISSLDVDSDADEETNWDAFEEIEGSVPRDAVSELSASEASIGVGEGCLSDADCTSSCAPRCETTLRICVQCIGAPGDCANQK
jgi:hypothetical protein